MCVHAYVYMQILVVVSLNNSLTSESWLVGVDIKYGGIADLKTIEGAGASDGISSHIWENDPIPHV
jgi:hypothetical protein